MNKSSKTNQQLLLEMEELKARLDVAQQRLQEANERMQAEMTEDKRTEQVMEERLKFETLLAELSVRFINLPVDQIDSEIKEAQRRICEFLDLDRSSLWQVCEGEPGMLLLTHIHQIQGGTPAPERLNAMDFFPWTVQKVLAGETITMTKMSDLPPEAGRDRESHHLYRTKSNVLVPLSVGGGSVFGLLTFAVMREERSWPETVVMGFKLIAQVFANALARRLADQALRESEAKLSMATSAAGAGLWIMEPDTGHVWVTPKTRELLHFAPDEEMNYESFFKAVHPEDRDRVNQAVQQSVQSGENLHCDYRIVQPDGSIRWMAARGQRHLKSTGESDRLMGVSLDITEGKQMEEQLKERLRFETMLAEISGRFVNLPSDRIDSEIEDAQRCVCECLDLDLSAVWQGSPQDQDGVTMTHLYRRVAGPPPPEPMVARLHFPWFWRQIRAGNIVKLSSLAELPEEAALDREYCTYFSVKSNLSLPLSAGGGTPFGVVAFNTTLEEHTWPEEIVRRLQLVAEVFANALERKRMEGQLRERLFEIEELKQRLERENIYLREEVKLLVQHTDIVGQSAAM